MSKDQEPPKGRFTTNGPDLEPATGEYETLRDALEARKSVGGVPGGCTIDLSVFDPPKPEEIGDGK